MEQLARMRDTTADVCVIAGDTNLKSDIETRDVVSRYMSTNWGLVDNCIDKKDDFILILGTTMSNAGGHSVVFRKKFWHNPHYAVWATMEIGHTVPDPQAVSSPSSRIAKQMLQEVADHVLAPPNAGAPATVPQSSLQPSAGAPAAVPQSSPQPSAGAPAAVAQSSLQPAMDAETPAHAPPPGLATCPPAATAPAAAPTQPSQPEQLAAPQGAARPGAERQRQRPAAVRQPAAVAQTPLRKRVLRQLASCARRRCT